MSADNALKEFYALGERYQRLPKWAAWMMGRLAGELEATMKHTAVKTERMGKPKILGWYVVRDGEQIAWFKTKQSAAAYAKAHGGVPTPEFA